MRRSQAGAEPCHQILISVDKNNNIPLSKVVLTEMMLKTSIQLIKKKQPQNMKDTKKTSRVFTNRHV